MNSNKKLIITIRMIYMNLIDQYRVEYVPVGKWRYWIKGPARVYLKNGRKHRDGDLPAVEYENGGKTWHINGLLHREGDMPARELASGRKEWYKHGKRHRDNDLPAIVWSNGWTEWWKNGIQYRPKK